MRIINYLFLFHFVYCGGVGFSVVDGFELVGKISILWGCVNSSEYRLKRGNEHWGVLGSGFRVRLNFTMINPSACDTQDALATQWVSGS